MSFTGSTAAGKSICTSAGKNLKKSVIELGGSDPFIVMRDCDLNKAVDIAIESRLANSGQVCFASKRFIIHESQIEEFSSILEKRVSEMKIGDPFEEDTRIGPLSRRELFDKLVDQVERGLNFESGRGGGKAELLFGGESIEENNIYFPTAIKVPNFQAPLHLNLTDDPETLSEELKNSYYARG